MIPRRAAIAALTLALSLLPVTGNARPDPTTPEKTAAQPEKSAGSKSAAKKLEWLAFDAAAAKASKQNKHLIVDIYTTWCGWCRVMDRETYGNTEVASYLTDNFVLAKVNGESANKLHWNGEELSERQFARKVGVTGYPATYFMKPNAELLGGVPGYVKAPDFMIYSRYVATRWYQKGKIQDYVDSLRTAAQ
jgi:thioredoxin-related protein